jgi:hypothetical protein
MANLRSQETSARKDIQSRGLTSDPGQQTFSKLNVMLSLNDCLNNHTHNLNEMPTTPPAFNSDRG